MSKAYTVGRGSTVEIKIPKQHDTVGKLHVEIEETGDGVRITDLQSTNGTFVRAGKKWEEIKGTRVVEMDSELMLGEYRTTPRELLAAAKPVAKEKTKRNPGPPPLPGKKRSGPRRNEFGEIVHE
jgi:predicted component of type VI protein secretion system